MIGVVMLRGGNPEVRYLKVGCPGLSAEYRIAKERGLSFRFAKLVSFYSCGNVQVAGILTSKIAQESMTPETLRDYIIEIGCWGDGSSPDIATALGTHFNVG